MNSSEYLKVLSHLAKSHTTDLPEITRSLSKVIKQRQTWRRTHVFSDGVASMI